MKPADSAPNGLLERDITRWVKGDTSDVAKALRLYRTIKHDPIIDPHTHYETTQIVKNRRWDNPTQLFLGVPNAKRTDGTGIGFDHYAGRVMLAQGVTEELVYGRAGAGAPLPNAAFDKERFIALVGAFEKAFPNPSARWFKVALEEVFGISVELRHSNALQIWEALSAKLSSEHFLPQQMLIRHGVRVALTTDSPIDTLDEHLINRDSKCAVRLLPTFRPDRILYPEANSRFPEKDFQLLLEQLSKLSGISTASFEGCLAALCSRMDFFSSHGCLAMDLGIENFPDHEISHPAAACVFEKSCSGMAVSPEDGETWKAFMLAFLCEEAAKRKWVQYFHQGAARNLNRPIFLNHGADVGGDGPGEPINRRGFIQLINHLYSRKAAGSVDGTALAKSVFFTMNASDFEFVLDSINGFQGNSAGIRAKLQLGPPWWMNDYVDANASVLRLMSNRGFVQSAIGMLSDARSLPPVIGRIIEYRAVLSAELVNLLPDLPEAELTEIAHDIAYRNVARFLGVEDLVSEQ